ncbi:MAG: 50S ribosomal protein L7Ae [Candidatus Lokiarchaeota archaeon]|nr:50S ribosomal protein L7Ae [Candidatus Lokiarchaeota archaeon]
MSYVKINIPDKLKKKVIDTISNISSTPETKIKKGMNEVTKSIERGIAKLVIIAEDVDPPEVVFHLPLLCDEKNIPYIYVNTKKDLGKAVGLKIDTSSLAIIIPGEDNVAAIKDIISQVNKLK